MLNEADYIIMPYIMDLRTPPSPRLHVYYRNQHYIEFAIRNNEYLTVDGVLVDVSRIERLPDGNQKLVIEADDRDYVVIEVWEAKSE